MPRQAVPLLTRARIGPGEVILPAVSLTTFDRLRATLDPNIADYADPDLRITITARLSFDGGQTWDATVFTDIVGNSFTKGGGLPFTEYPYSKTRDGVELVFDRIQVTITLNKSIRIGLLGDAETKP